MPEVMGALPCVSHECSAHLPLCPPALHLHCPPEGVLPEHLLLMAPCLHQFRWLLPPLRFPPAAAGVQPAQLPSVHVAGQACSQLAGFVVAAGAQRRAQPASQAHLTGLAPAPQKPGGRVLLQYVRPGPGG
jgi:hypothetical protein